ncbi:Protein SufA [Buchnera aphidicola (Eriosoma lanigerum)]|jgi:Fe-S cluster assembly protein SufA|uniref:iron-sulfur cluster assembly accessory protein n=1 Tax=Buchnera aphidicola TaxID=9 RepID=UPI0034644287
MIESYNTKIINKENKWKGIHLTKKAEDQIHSLLQQSNDFIGVRIQIKKSGCAGFRYHVEQIKEQKKEELIFYFTHFIVCIPLQQINLLNDMTVDFVTEGVNQLFKFYNKKVKFSCGCGESFSLIK